MSALVEVRDVSKLYGPSVALSNVSLTLENGCITGLLGPNGAGKTTLLRCIAALTDPSSGEILFRGHGVTLDDSLKMGFMPEERGLYKQMGIAEQAVYFARLKGMSRADAKSSLLELFEKFNLSRNWKSRPDELSKGMARKVQFIISILHKPEVLILDEPFSGLDPVNAESMRREIVRLRDEGMCIVLSTHDMSSVESLCSRVAFLNKSKLICNGSVDEVKGSLRHEDGSLPDMNEIFIRMSGEWE